MSRPFGYAVPNPFTLTPSAALDIVLIVGPTASGKTALSIALAREMEGEIVSADSRQIYRGLDVGTAKPTLEERAAIKHHFVDELDPGQPISAGDFFREAEARIRLIRGRGRVPLVVGGSTLYVDALLNGIADIPHVEPEVRELLKQRLHVEGSEALFRELSEVDPKSAATMDPTKSQRIVRALEVFHGTGTPLSRYHASRVTPSFSYRGVLLKRNRADLYNRINRRVDAMMAAGLVREVRDLLDSGLDPRGNALQTIGYSEVVAHLSGEIDQDEMLRLIKRNTRRYAKRQITWFKRYRDFMVVDADTEPQKLFSLVTAGRQSKTPE